MDVLPRAVENAPAAVVIARAEAHTVARKEIRCTFGIEREAGSNVQRRYSSTIIFATSIPVTWAPIVMMFALLESCARCA